jgi:hypothetical protein
MKDSLITASSQGALPNPGTSPEIKPETGWLPRPKPEPPSRPPAPKPCGWDVLSDRERAYLDTMHGMKPAFAVSFERRERENILALTGMTREQFENREAPESLLAYLRCKSQWAAGSPFGIVRMQITQSSTWNGKPRTYQKGQDCGIGTNIDGDVAAEFISGQAAITLPTLTIRILCSVWPSGVGAVRSPKPKDANGVEVELLGAMVAPAQQFYRGDLVLHPHPLPLKAPTDYLDHLVRQSLDFGMIEILCRGRWQDDPAKLKPCPLPERKKLPEGNPNDRRAHRFREMKAAPTYWFDPTKNQFFQNSGPQ